jgi:phasin family protein
MSSFQAAAGLPFASARHFRFVPLSLDTLFEAYRKNLAALSSANQAAFDGITTMIQRQSILFNAAADDYSRGVNDVLAAASLEEKARRQADTARHAYESTFARFGELYEIATKAHLAAADILNARLTEAMDEFKALFAATAESEAAPVEQPAALVAPPVEITVEAEPVSAPAADPAPVDMEPAATIAEPIVQSEEPAEDEEPEDLIAPKPTKTTPRGSRTTGASGGRSARRPPSRG